MLFQQFLQTLREKCRVGPGESILAAVSGGPDSRTLLHLLIRCGNPLVVAHFNHHLRREADEEARLLEIKVKEMNLEFIAGEADVSVVARTGGASLEEAARSARYAFLTRVAREKNIRLVAAGHTADDQAETVMMNILRGCGLNGLSGMPFRRNMGQENQPAEIIRPLLPFWREQIEDYCRQHELNPFRDQTNADTHYFRNRVRLELLPFMQEYNPAVKTHLYNLSQSVSVEREMIKKAVSAAWDKTIRREKDGWIFFAVDEILKENEAVRQGILRRLLEKMARPDQSVEYAEIQRLDRFLTRTEEGKRLSLFGNLTACRAADGIWIGKGIRPPLEGNWPRLESTEDIFVFNPGEMELPGGIRMNLEVVPAGSFPGRKALAADPRQTYLDGDKIKFPLKIRSWREGDVFKPSGLGGKTVNLADFLAARKIPLEARRNLPLVINGDEIIWVGGVRVAESVLVTGLTRNIIHMEMITGQEDQQR